MSGVTRQSYAPEIRIIRLMCTGRVDLGFILRAFSSGADGVIIGGCWPGECHYVTEGNYDALGNVYLSKRLLERIGLRPERVRIEWIGASEGNRFAEAMSSFADTLRELGPLGEGEGIDEAGLERGLGAVTHLVPYIKLVEREKLRVPVKSETAYQELFGGASFRRLFEELIADKLVIRQILMLLRDTPRSTGEISELLGLSPSDVSRHMQASSRQGLVAFDVQQQLYTLAGAG